MTCGEPLDLGLLPPTDTPTADPGQPSADELDAAVMSAFHDFLVEHDAYHTPTAPADELELRLRDATTPHDAHGPGFIDLYERFGAAVARTAPTRGREHAHAAMLDHLRGSLEAFRSGVADGPGRGEERFFAGSILEWQFAGAACLAGVQELCPPT